MIFQLDSLYYSNSVKLDGNKRLQSVISNLNGEGIDCLGGIFKADLIWWGFIVYFFFANVSATTTVDWSITVTVLNALLRPSPDSWDYLQLVFFNIMLSLFVFKGATRQNDDIWEDHSSYLLRRYLYSDSSSSWLLTILKFHKISDQVKKVFVIFSVFFICVYFGRCYSNSWPCSADYHRK